MIILAIDTSTGPCSVSIYKGGKVAVYLENPEKTTQSICLVPLIEEALKKASITYKDVSLVASTIGPGSFTGIRVGLATARGIAFSGNIKAAGFNSLDVMAHGANAAHVLSILNAGKGEVYYRAYEASKPLFDTQLGTIEEALASIKKPDVIVGNMPVCNGAITFPRADALAKLAASQAALATAMAPFYLRAPDAKLPAA